MAATEDNLRVMERFFAIVNPAAGGGRSVTLAGPALSRLRERGLQIDVIASSGPGHAVQLSREAYAQGYRRFLAVGGDGTAHEILNGLFAAGTPARRVALGFLPLGTGNSFLRDFSEDGVNASMEALLQGRTRPVDLLRLEHAEGQVISFNLLSLGFTADVGARQSPPEAARLAWLFAGRFFARCAAAPALLPAPMRRRKGLGRTPRALSCFQQFQVHRRQNADRSGRQRLGWIYRVRSLGSARPPQPAPQFAKAV